MTMRTMRLSLTVAAAVLVGHTALAAQATYDFIACTSSKRILVEANADLVAFGVESWGVVASSTTSFWEKASTH